MKKNQVYKITPFKNNNNNNFNHDFLQNSMNEELTKVIAMRLDNQI